MSPYCLATDYKMVKCQISDVLNNNQYHSSITVYQTQFINIGWTSGFYVCQLTCSIQFVPYQMESMATAFKQFFMYLQDLILKFMSFHKEIRFSHEMFNVKNLFHLRTSPIYLYKKITFTQVIVLKLKCDILWRRVIFVFKSSFGPPLLYSSTWMFLYSTLTFDLIQLQPFSSFI